MGIKVNTLHISIPTFERLPIETLLLRNTGALHRLWIRYELMCGRTVQISPSIPQIEELGMSIIAV